MDGYSETDDNNICRVTYKKSESRAILAATPRPPTGRQDGFFFAHRANTGPMTVYAGPNQSPKRERGVCSAGLRFVLVLKSAFPGTDILRNGFDLSATVCV